MSAVEKQNDYRKAIWEFDWDNTMRKSHQAWSTFAAKKWSDTQIREWEHNTRVSAWQDAANIRDFKFANQRKAHNASVQAYNKQLDYNELAESIALNDGTRKYNERMTEIGFQNEELLMNFNHNKIAEALKLKEAKEMKNLRSKGIAIGLRDAVTEANLTARQSLLQLEKAKADAARKGVELTLENLQQQGKVRAMGQTGRSARKNLQSVLAGHGRGQAALVEMITMQEKDNHLAFEGITKKLASAKGQKHLDYMTLATEVDQIQRRSEKQIGMKKEATGIGQRQLQESLKSATKQKEADEMTAGLQRWSADMAADANIVPDAVRDPDPTFPVQEPAPRTVAPPKLAKI